jgi:hypothetical protein
MGMCRTLGFRTGRRQGSPPIVALFSAGPVLALSPDANPV